MRKLKLILIILGIILIFYILSNANFSYYQSYDDKNLENDKKQKLKSSGYWEIGPIEIDENDPTKNWSITAATYDWCHGFGTWEDPYIIENLTIDGQDTSNCLRIDNSDVYFTIRNSTFINGEGEYWHSGGIRLENVTNGRLVNNHCSFNQQGIYLATSNNNTISGNTANHNTIHGIVLYDQCNDTRIIGNTACFNYRGIVIEEKYTYYNAYNNLVIDNNASYNIAVGLSCVFINDTEILNNTAINNGVYPTAGYGISVQASRNITISLNKVQGNGYGMNIYNNQDCKIFNNTAISNEDYGIHIEVCTNINVLDNDISFSQSAIMLRSESSVLRRNYNNTVSGNRVKNSYWGIYLFYTDNNTILENTAKDNYCGIYLRRSYDNNVSGNILIGNDNCIIEEECAGNTLENNYCDIESRIPSYNLLLLIGVISLAIIILIREKKVILE